MEQRFVSWSFKCAVSVVTTTPQKFHEGCDRREANAKATLQYQLSYRVSRRVFLVDILGTTTIREPVVLLHMCFRKVHDLET